MATAKKTTAKKTTTKKTVKTTPKKAELSYGEKCLAWIAITAVVGYLIYLALEYFM